MTIAALALGLVIGAVLGALGGGGAILTVPILVYLLGQTPQDATTSSLVIVGITAVAGTIGHARARRVRWGIGVSFGITGTAAAYAGTALNRQIDSRYLLIGFAAVMIAAATGMLLRAGKDPDRHDLSQDHEPGSPGTPGRRPVMGGTETAELTQAPAPAASIRAGHVGKVIAAGVVIGFMTGLFGVGGGFIIVPALTLVVGLPMSGAVGTSLLVIALNSATSLAARAGTAHLDWNVIVPFTAAAIAGTSLGRRMADRLPSASLSRAFAGLLILLAVYVAIHNLLALR